MTTSLGRDWIGVGLRPAHYPYIFERWPEVDFFEIISENFLTDAPLPKKHLAKIRDRYPVVLHGVGLDLLGHAPLDLAYLDRVAALADLIDAPFVTDHLCWVASGGMSHHDLLPVPHCPDVRDLAITRAKLVKERLGRPFGVENLSSYVSFRASTMTEWELVMSVATGAEVGILLDINNVFVSSKNHGFDPLNYLDAIDYSRVLEVHLAGHDPSLGHVIVDTHDRAVSDEVWELYAHAWRRGGPFPTLIEWDSAIPPMPELLREVERARRVRA